MKSKKSLDTVVKISDYCSDIEFTVVDKIPYGSKIWNIGKHMPDGYLPLVYTGGYDKCQVIAEQGYKAVKTEDAELILYVTGFGYGKISKMERYLKKYKGKEKSRNILYKKIEQALIALKKVPGAEEL